MASSATYLSIVTPALFDNTVVITLQTYNAVPNGIFISSPIAITAGDSEQVVATKIKSQLDQDLILQGFNYNSRPVFSTESPLDSWQIGRSEHVISLWSEAQFSISVVDNGVGFKYRLNNVPMLCTLEDCRRIGPAINQTFKKLSGGDLTDDEVITLVHAACSEGTAYLHNPIVTRTYIHEEICINTTCIFLNKFPIIDWDAPVIRRPNIFNVLPVTTFTDVVTRYAVNRLTGEVTFRFAQNLLFNYEPFDYNNDVKMSYRAGYTFIPEPVKEQFIKLSKLYDRSSGIMGLNAGSTKIEFESNRDHKKFLMADLIEYTLAPDY